MVGLRARLIAMLIGVMVLAFVLLVVGVDYGLRADVARLAQRNVDAGTNALSGAIDARVESVRSTILQGAAQTSLADALHRRDPAALRTISADVAEAGSLAFVVVTDARGTVLAGSRDAHGSLARNAIVASAMAGSLTGGPQLLDAADLRTLGVSAHAPALALVTGSPVNVNGSVVGILYGGSLLDATSNAVDDVSRFTGGATGIVVDGRLAATSLAASDGSKRIGLAIAHANDVLRRASYAGEQRIGGVKYFMKLAPLPSFDGSVIGAYWFGVPAAQFDAVVDNTLRQIVLWGAIGLAVALVAGSIFATRIGRAIVRRSEEVNASAEELKVLVVGGEVSGDHITRTRETLETIRGLVEQRRSDEHLETLARQAVDDVVVIDTLAAELSSRMRDASVRVERLSAVARALDELVAGARPSRN